MNIRAGSTDAQQQRLAAAQAAIAPWQAALADLAHWFTGQRETIWPADAAAQADQRVESLRTTFERLARGEDAVASRTTAAIAAASAPRIDALLAGRRASRPQATVLWQRRQKGVFDLALWSVLQRVAAASPPGRPARLAGLHRAMADAPSPAPGISPTFEFAQTPSARAFFEQSLRRVLEVLADKTGSDGDIYLRIRPAQPFDAGLPSIVAFSRAWSAAVAGVYLDCLMRHCGGDARLAARDLWAGRLDAVRFRTAPGLTALPTHAGAMHLDLWTCIVKAQALAFDAARWQRHAEGAGWHGVRIDMHAFCGDTRRRASVTAPSGSIETLYRSVFIDRVLSGLDRMAGIDKQAMDSDASADEHAVAIEIERPHGGHLPNLRLLLRWRDPSQGPLRWAADAEDAPCDVDGPAVARWLAGQGHAGLAHELPDRTLDWRAARSSAAGGGACPLGDAALWQALDADVLWIDPALVVCQGGACWELPVDLSEHGSRVEWSLPAGTLLPEGLDRDRLRRAVGAPGAVRWLATESGAGAFVMAAIDVDATRPAGRD
jgi:hypothetical protein